MASKHPFLSLVKRSQFYRLSGVALLDSMPKRREAHGIPASMIPATRQSLSSWEQAVLVPGWDCHVTPTCPCTRQHIDDNHRSSLIPHPSPNSLIAQLSITIYPRHPPALGVDPTWQYLSLGLDMILLARPIKAFKVICLCAYRLRQPSLSQASIPSKRMQGDKQAAVADTQISGQRLKDALESNGALDSLRARTRAEIYKLLNNQTPGRSQRKGLSNQEFIMTELIQTGQPQIPLDRSFLAARLGIQEDSTTQQNPLLHAVIQKVCPQGWDADTPDSCPS